MGEGGVSFEKLRGDWVCFLQGTAREGLGFLIVCSVWYGFNQAFCIASTFPQIETSIAQPCPAHLSRAWSFCYEALRFLLPPGFAGQQILQEVAIRCACRDEYGSVPCIINCEFSFRSPRVSFLHGLMLRCCLSYAVVSRRSFRHVGSSCSACMFLVSPFPLVDVAVYCRPLSS